MNMIDLHMYCTAKGEDEKTRSTRQQQHSSSRRGSGAGHQLHQRQNQQQPKPAPEMEAESEEHEEAVTRAALGLPLELLLPQLDEHATRLLAVLERALRLALEFADLAAANASGNPSATCGLLPSQTPTHSDLAEHSSPPPLPLSERNNTGTLDEQRESHRVCTRSIDSYRV